MAGPSVRAEVKWVGLDKLVTHLQKTLPKEINWFMKEVSKEAAGEARDKAKTLVPIDTGALQKSIRIENIPKRYGTWYIGISAGGYERNPKTGRIVDYARWVEEGTSRMRARPFIRPAMHWMYTRRFKPILWRWMAKIPG